MRSKTELMEELINCYQRLEFLKQFTNEGCKSSRITFELYIRKLELQLKQLL